MYTHNEIRTAMDEGNINGSICEKALREIKNLETAIYKRKDIAPNEIEAIEMICQLAEELRQHTKNRMIIDKPHLPRKLRDFLQLNIAIQVLDKSKLKYSFCEGGSLLKVSDDSQWYIAKNNQIFKVS